MHDPLGAVGRLFVFLPPFLLALILHECAHGWVAERFGDPTARRAGRITLDPKAHIDAAGAIFFVVSTLSLGFSLGWAKPVPINSRNFRSPARDDAIVAASGPLVNFAQAWVWWGVLFALAFLAGGSSSALVGFGLELAQAGVIVNVALACFNILPIPPLDGSHILAWMLGEKAYLVERLAPFGFPILLVLFVTGLIGVIFTPLMRAVLSLFPAF
jgi:Zn-dependent protease